MTPTATATQTTTPVTLPHARTQTKMSLFRAYPEMELAESVYDVSGRLLLTAGGVLTEGILAALTHRCQRGTFSGTLSVWL